MTNEKALALLREGFDSYTKQAQESERTYYKAIGAAEACQQLLAMVAKEAAEGEECR